MIALRNRRLQGNHSKNNRQSLSFFFFVYVYWTHKLDVCGWMTCQESGEGLEHLKKFRNKEINQDITLSGSKNASLLC